MFTGIITAIGTIREARNTGDLHAVITCPWDPAGIAIGASIACSGCCLTVVEKGGDWFAVEVSGESLAKTHLGDWAAGSRINLELSLKLGDELGGHLVYGHVDGVGKVVSMTPEGGSVRFVFEAPTEVARFVAAKGSIAIDGISLTVNEVDGNRFGVNVISHTQAVTTLNSAGAMAITTSGRSARRASPARSVNGSAVSAKLAKVLVPEPMDSPVMPKSDSASK